MAKEWFDVTVKESYRHTYKVLARDEQEADGLVNAMVNNGDVDPTQDGIRPYDRETDVERSGHPDEDGEFWGLGDDGEPENWRYQELKETKASKRRRKENAKCQRNK